MRANEPDQRREKRSRRKVGNRKPGRPNKAISIANSPTKACWDCSVGGWRSQTRDRIPWAIRQDLGCAAPNACSCC